MKKYLTILLFAISSLARCQDSNIVCNREIYDYVVDSLKPYQDSIGYNSFVPIPLTSISTHISQGDSLIIINGDTIGVDSIATMWLLSSAYTYESNPAYQSVLNHIANTGHIGYFVTKKVKIIYKKQ